MQHVALIKGEITPDDEVLVRVHSECLTGDVFGSERATAVLSSTGPCGWWRRPVRG